MASDLSIQITGGLGPARRRGFLLLDRAERNPVNWRKLPANRENVMNYLSALVLMAAALPAQEAKETAAEAEVKRLAVPEKLMPKGKSLLFLLRAEGEQVYRAEKKGDELAWVFQEPDAVLRDYETGEKAGTHGKGPFWADGGVGKVNAKVFESVPSSRPGALAWLLLEVTGEPTGRFKKVSHIQRIDTWAGQPPTSKPRKEGEINKAHYHATYAFWGER
jgi:hypothetical protein